jgi:hypothetical protein
MKDLVFRNAEIVIVITEQTASDYQELETEGNQPKHGS